MRIPNWSTALRLPRRTVRLRLTLLYGGLFLVSGVTLLAITYLLMTTTVFGDAPIVNMHNVQGPDVKPPAGAPLEATLREDNEPPQLRQLLLLAGTTMAIMLALSIALGWLMAGRALRPLRTITATTRQISENNLHQRLDMPGPGDELKDLADTIDGLLARLDTAFDTQKEALDAQQRFVANASHELRRPLTLERATLEIALADPDATTQSLRSTCERVLATAKQQEKLIDTLLTLARGQRGLDQHEPFDIAAIADEVLLARRAEVQRRNLRVHAVLEPTEALGDAHLAERLVVNLVDNAIRHNLPGGRIQVTTGTQDGHAVLAVANSGPAVPSSEIDRLLRPFQRLGPDRTNHGDGHGLGLSIVAAIATAHNAELRVQPRLQGGLEVEIHFLEPTGVRTDRGPA
jgi:signal transduction histidine kinase